MTENNKDKSNPSQNTEQKPGLFAKASTWAVNNPVKSTAGIALATQGAVKVGTLAYEKTRDYFAEKTTEPAKEQAAALVGGIARGFSKRFG